MRFESRVVLDKSQTCPCPQCSPTLFESRVVLDGSQTLPNWVKKYKEFESRVVLDESQTLELTFRLDPVFESRVVLDGSQTARDVGATMTEFESRVTLVQAQAEANASACFFINSVYVKNPSCFPTKTGRVVANDPKTTTNLGRGFKGGSLLEDGYSMLHWETHQPLGFRIIIFPSWVRHRYIFFINIIKSQEQNVFTKLRIH